VREGEPADGAHASAPPDLIVYGKNAVREALAGRRGVQRILVTRARAGDDLIPLVQEWKASAGPSRSAGTPSSQAPGNAAIERWTAEELSAFLGTDEHQGIGAVVDPYPYVDAMLLLQKFTLVVALDGVHDPHNLGAIIRTAEAAGAGVIIPRHRAARVTASVVRASSGATEHASIAQVRNLSDFLLAAKAAGFWIYGATAEGRSLYSAEDFRPPTCFVMGSEGAGLGRRVTSLCDVVVRLPLAGRVDSLNVGVTAGILLYEAVRQRTTGNDSRTCFE